MKDGKQLIFNNRTELGVTILGKDFTIFFYTRISKFQNFKHSLLDIGKELP